MRVKLGDIFEIGSGGTPSKSNPEYYGGDIPWVKTGDLKNEYLYEVEDFITEEGLKNSAAKVYEADTVLIAMYGATIGATSILKINACTNQACAAIKKNEQVIPEYLYYFLRSKKKKFVKDGVGGAQPNISAGYLKKVEMELPSIEDQRVIVDILEKISDIVIKRKQEIQSLDNLIKARFVEMFGDPVVHLYKGETVKLDTVADKITVGFVGEASNEYADEGVPYLRTQNVRVNRIDLNGLIYVNEAFHNKNQKSIIHPGDVVISRVGVNRGMAAMIPDSLPEANIANCLIVGQTDNINSYYLAFYMNMSFGKRPQFGASVGSAQGVINTSILKKWEVYVPDKKLQDDFFEFSSQIDKSKVAVQKALDETQLLFDSLMQKYFG